MSNVMQGAPIPQRWICRSRCSCGRTWQTAVGSHSIRRNICGSRRVFQRSWSPILPAWESSCGQLLHPVKSGKVPARVIQDLRVGGMVGSFDRHDEFSQLRIFVAKISGELLLGLSGTNQQNLMGASQCLGDVIEKMMIGGRSMTAMRALAAVDPLMLIFRMHHGLFLFGRRKVP